MSTILRKIGLSCHVRQVYPAQSETEQGEGASRSLPFDNFVVCLNVIAVFGLSPRALSADLDNIFNRISDMFGKTGITLNEKEMGSAFVPLIAPYLSNQPVSVFASRLLVLATRLQENRCSALKHDVNPELFRSHAKFTVFSATPDRFRSFQCTLPVIERCALESSELGGLEAVASNVLYYEPPWDPQRHKENTTWKGIDSFVWIVRPHLVDTS
ncbi:hypothetical protein BLNAU_22744 [Blattamonas nauphoetae]|uniref:Uncharacterized protein n=1 Tax=Blattamonas nauphoetae TaxID=2049346 RepID=A0ABQ9WUF2_9EUKA|nr:hypothetical protein BLNAU_22744 [Blattamonas nauphoetae]